MQHAETTALAIYDMDKTITRKATFGPFIAHVIRHYHPWRVLLLPVMALVTLAYALKLISRSRLKEINLALLLGRRIDALAAARIAASFARETRRVNFLEEALHRIAQDRKDGYRVVLATASYHFYAEAIARLLGIDDVIATRCLNDGPEVMLPRIAGENCYGAAKLMMVRGWLARQQLERARCRIRFYSDHVSDAPCLGWADQAFAVNPHGPLRHLAAERRWPVLDWPA